MNHDKGRLFYEKLKKERKMAIFEILMCFSNRSRNKGHLLSLLNFYISFFLTKPLI